MGLYPVQRADLQTFCAGWSILANKADQDYDDAILSSTADIGLAVPDAPAGNLNVSLDQAAYVLSRDLAVYYMRWKFERDPETQAPPEALEKVYDQILNRLKLLATNVEKQVGTIRIEGFCRLPPPRLPDLPAGGCVNWGDRGYPGEERW